MGCVSSDGFVYEDGLTGIEKETNLFPIEFVQQNLIMENNPMLFNQATLQAKISEQEDAELIKTIDFKSLIDEFQVIYKSQLYSELKNVKKHDIKILEAVIRALCTQVLNKKFMSVNRGEINIKQCKIHIAESILSILLECLKFTIKKYSINHANALFGRLQKFSKKLCTFLKTKYPRGQNLDAGKLGKEFKEFDCTQNFQHDIIANANVIFKTKNKIVEYQCPKKKEEKPIDGPQLKLRMSFGPRIFLSLFFCSAINFSLFSSFFHKKLKYMFFFHLLTKSQL